MNPDFSILIPVLNEARYLRQCLEGLEAQSLERERFEIIVVDNGSTDGTLDLLEAWPDVRVLHEPQRDPYIARNRAMEVASGRYFVFTDADCVAERDWLARIDESFEGGADIIVGRLLYPQDSTFWLDRYADYYDVKTQWLFDAPVNECLYGHAGNMAIRKEVIDAIGPFLPMPVVGDTEILQRALAKNPESDLRYESGVAVTHLEVQTLRDMLPKLRRYGSYSRAVSRASTYRSLTLLERLRVTGLCILRNRYGPIRTLGLAGALLLGVLSFEFGHRFAREARS